jgi:hypothetical protein
MGLDLAGQIFVGVFLFIFGVGFRWLMGTSRRVQALEADLKLIRTESNNDLKLVALEVKNSIASLTNSIGGFEKSLEWIVKTVRQSEQDITLMKVENKLKQP